MYQQFWESWKNDYITSLQIRNKWYKVNENLKIGDMVIVQDENTPTAKWPLGRIAAVQHSNDGLVRSASVTITGRKKKDGVSITSTKLLDRPVQKLCVLLPEEVSIPTKTDDEQ